MSTAWVIIPIVLVVLLIALLVVGPIAWLRHKASASRARLAAELSLEPPLRGPERATYCGTTGAYSRVSGTGSIALTKHRLLFRKITGGGVDIALSDVSGLSLARVFHGSVVGNRMHLVVHTALGDVGYLVSDTDEWLAAIERAAPHLSAP